MSVCLAPAGVSGEERCVSDSLAQGSAIAGWDYKRKAVRMSDTKLVLHVVLLNTIRVFPSLPVFPLTECV